MRIVLDTNVVVSGLLSETGAPAQVLELCLAGDVDVVVDSRILAEYHDVLHRPKLDLDAYDVDAFLDVLRYAEYVVPVPLRLTIPDPTDMPFLEVAVAGAVDAVVTGNVKHFRPAEGRLAISVLSPRHFLDVLAGH